MTLLELVKERRNLYIQHRAASDPIMRSILREALESNWHAIAEMTPYPGHAADIARRYAR